MTTRDSPYPDPRPCRGEIWVANLDPTIGTEIKKSRPVIVVSSDAAGRLPIKLVAPITGWQPRFENNFWHLKIEPTPANGLSKTSSIDALQLRGLDLLRFSQKLGRLAEPEMEDLAAIIAALVEYV